MSPEHAWVTGFVAAARTTVERTAANYQALVDKEADQKSHAAAHKETLADGYWQMRFNALRKLEAARAVASAAEDVAASITKET